MRILIGETGTLGITQDGIKRLIELGHPVFETWNREAQDSHGIYKMSDSSYYLPWLSTVRHLPTLLKLHEESADYFDVGVISVLIPDRCLYVVKYDWIERREHAYELGGQLA